MSAVNVLIGAAVVFVFMRAVCEPKLSPGREIWNRVLGLRPADAAVLAGVRFVGTFSLLVGLGAGIGVVLTWWVESLDPAAIGNVAGQKAIDRVEGLLALFAAGELVLSRLGVLVSIAYVVLFAIGLLFWSARSTRDVGERIRATVEELRELGLANKLPYMAPDERMKRVDEAIAAAHVANADGGVVEALFTRRFQYDVVRRVDPRLLREVGDRVSGSHAASVFRFLISAPLSHQVKRAGRIVSALVMVTMVPASLVVASADLDKAMDKKRPALEALEAALTLEVDLSRETEGKENEEDEEDEEEWCEAVGAVLPADACIAAAEFGAAFEAAWGASLVDRSGMYVRAEAEGISDARRTWARRQVLLESVAPRTATVNVVEAASGTSERQAWPHGVMDAELKARTRPGPVTSFGKRAGKIFGEVARSVSGRVAVEVADRPLTFRELASTAAAAAVGLSIDDVGLGGTEPTLMDRLSSGTLEETLGKLVEEEVRRPEDVEPLRRAANLAAMSAASRVRYTMREVGEPMRIDGDTMGMVKEFVDSELVRNYKGMIDRVTQLEFPKRKPTSARVSLEAVSSSSNVDWDKVESTLGQYKAAGRGVNLDSLASYSSVFPGIEGQRAQTEEARIAHILDADRAKVDYGGPPEVLRNVDGREGLKMVKAAEATKSASYRLGLARSFPRLRAYHRVGGVLIGREPDAVAKGLDLVGVDFSVDEVGRELTIHLTHADGTKTAVGPYDPAIAHLALAYAADGRPVTVTIVSASPLTDRKILLHPALIDTEVGCHAIRLDQFVDRFGQEGLLGARRLAERVQSERVMGLYHRAWGTRLLGLLDRESATEEITRLRDFARQISESSDLSSTVPIGTSATQALKPLRQRQELFDTKLVEILEACEIEAERKISVGCVEEHTRQAGKKTSRAKGLTHHWGAVPQIFPSSGVREEPYELDEELRFAQVPRDIWSGPLRFVVLKDIRIVPDAEVGLGFANESEPWEFEEIQELLEETVLNSVRVRPDELRTLRMMQQFTVAQRLFRAAFEGRLGEQFPIERLVEIMRETATHVDFDAVTTDRWLLRDEESVLETVTMQLREALGVPAVQQATCLGDDRG